jgi:CRP-like cAMP-binding protein
MQVNTAVNIFEGLTPEEKDAFVGVCSEVDFTAGDRVFTEGDVEDDVHIVLSGQVRIAKAISLDVDRTLAVLGEGEVFGELALVGRGVRTAHADALTDTQVLNLTREAYETLSTRQPQLALKILGRFATMLAERLALTTDLLRDTVQWSLQVQGAASLDLHRVMHSRAEITVTLSNGAPVVGQLLKVEENEAGRMLTLSSSDGGLYMIPYHAVVSLQVPRDLLDDEDDV